MQVVSVVLGICASLVSGIILALVMVIIVISCREGQVVQAMACSAQSLQ